jgi:ribosome-binding factor A
MSSRRVLKAAEAIREVVGMAILVDLKDPRIRDVTVTHVEVSGDMRMAKVHVSVMGDETKQRLSLIGLTNAAGYLQSKVGDRLDTRYTPRIQFVLDQGVKNALLIQQILDQVLPKERLDTDINSTDEIEDELTDEGGDHIAEDGSDEIAGDGLDQDSLRT